MIEQVKEYLVNKYQLEINKFNDLKQQIDVLEKEILEDDSEKRYQENINSLNKKYSLFKRNSKEYKKEKQDFEDEYHESLLKFKEIHDKCKILRSESSKIDIYGLQRKLERVNNSTELKDLKLTEETALEVLSGEREL